MLLFVQTIFLYYQKVLYQELVTFRNKCAHDMGIPPFTVASNKLLGDLCIARPSTIHHLSNIDGVSDQWINKFSQKFLDKIKEFCTCYQLLKLDNACNDTDDSTSKSSMIQVRVPALITRPINSTNQRSVTNSNSVFFLY